MFLPNFIGFDDLFAQIERVQNTAAKAINWPPFNIRKLDENRYVMEMALAGFSSNDIEISLEKDQLVIKGHASTHNDGEYLHKGIATRNFERSFRLSDNIVIKDAKMINGVLKVFYESVIKAREMLKIPVKTE